MEYKAGESGELVIEFNSTGYPEEYKQTVVVQTNPGMGKTYLEVDAEVIPPPRSVPNSKSSSSH
jgi:hypothetical protein